MMAAVFVDLELYFIVPIYCLIIVINVVANATGLYFIFTLLYFIFTLLYLYFTLSLLYHYN